MKIFLLSLLSIVLLGASIVDEAKIRMGEQFPHSKMTNKYNIVLTKDEKVLLSQKSHQKVKKSIFTYFVTEDENNNKNYGFIISSKVRSKSATAIYFISSSRKIKAIEILKFNEPKQYEPKERWMQQFKDKNAEDKLQVRKNITNITGATLSAKTLVRQSKLALALYEFIKSK